MLLDVLFTILVRYTGICKELKHMVCICLCEGNVHVLCLVNTICQFGILKTKALLVVWCLKALPFFIYLGVCMHACSVQLRRLICSLTTCKIFLQVFQFSSSPAFILLP